MANLQREVDKRKKKLVQTVEFELPKPKRASKPKSKAKARR